MPYNEKSALTIPLNAFQGSKIVQISLYGKIQPDEAKNPECFFYSYGLSVIGLVWWKLDEMSDKRFSAAPKTIWHLSEKV